MNQNVTKKVVGVVETNNHELLIIISTLLTLLTLFATTTSILSRIKKETKKEEGFKTSIRLDIRSNTKDIEFLKHEMVELKGDVRAIRKVVGK